MRKTITLLTAVLIAASVFAQAPQKISYQAVIRNSSDQLVINESIGMQISILQGSASGPAVYVERQFSTTNANGLISIEIGNGVLTSGSFTTINWASDSYFIKTETDIKGGANYTISGTSQLLSVPYALHAKTAESITGQLTETDPVYTGSQASNITASDITKLSNLSGTNTGDQDISGLASTESVTKRLITKVDKVTGKGLSTNDYTTDEKTKLAGLGTILTIGQSYQGGKIFWLDATGQHGLIAATADQSAGIQWYNGVYRYTGTSGDGLYAGAMNTAMIVATQMADNQTGNFAAKVCADYSVTIGVVTYGDWYLPSRYELNLMYLQKTVVGGFASADYWSSSENLDGSAGTQGFYDGIQPDYYKAYTGYVRAVRAF